jgi:hypothetical protein
MSTSVDQRPFLSDDPQQGAQHICLIKRSFLPHIMESLTANTIFMSFVVVFIRENNTCYMLVTGVL